MIVVVLTLWLFSDFFLFASTDMRVKFAAHVLNTASVAFLVWRLIHTQIQFNKLKERVPSEER